MPWAGGEWPVTWGPWVGCGRAWQGGKAPLWARIVDTVQGSKFRTVLDGRARIWFPKGPSRNPSTESPRMLSACDSTHIFFMTYNFPAKKKKKILKWSLILIIRGSKWHSCRGTFSVSGADSWQQAKQWNAGILNVLNTWILTRRWGSVVELSLGALCPHVNPSVNVNFGFCFYSINKNCLFS